jgi:hypothetical protein
MRPGAPDGGTGGGRRLWCGHTWGEQTDVWGATGARAVYIVEGPCVAGSRLVGKCLALVRCVTALVARRCMVGGVHAIVRVVQT